MYRYLISKYGCISVKGNVIGGYGDIMVNNVYQMCKKESYCLSIVI